MGCQTIVFDGLDRSLTVQVVSDSVIFFRD